MKHRGTRGEHGGDVDGLHLGFSCRSTFVSPVHMPSAVRSSLVVASSLLSDVPQARMERVRSEDRHDGRT